MKMKRNKELTKRQKELYSFIKNVKNWRPPTFEMMRNFLGVRSNQTIIDHLSAIKRKGFDLNR